MTWYLTTRRWVWTVAAAVVVVPAVAAVGPTTVPVPGALSGLDFPLPLSVLLPCVPAWMVLWSCSRGEPNHERVAVRFAGGYDLAAIAVLLAVQLAAALLLTPWTQGFEPAIVVRNTAGYIAVALILRDWTAPVVATLVVTVLPIFCASFGTGPPPDRAASWWAWPLQSGASPSAAFIVAALALIATVLVCGERAGLVAARRGRKRAGSRSEIK